MDVKQSVAGKADRGEGPSVALQKRILRGIELAAECGEGITWVAEDRCYVPSQSKPNRRYLVTLSGKSERCRCYDYNHAELGACKHTVAALISWSKRVSFKVVKRHDSRLEEYVWDVVEVRAGVERVAFSGLSLTESYHTKWLLEGVGTGAAA